IQGGEEYTLVTYGDYGLVLRLYDKDDNYIATERHDNEGSTTFTTDANVRYFRAHITTYETTGGAINPEQIVDDLRVKLSLGNTSSGWTPNLDDTGQLVANVQSYVSEFEQTSQQIIAS